MEYNGILGNTKCVGDDGIGDMLHLIKVRSSYSQNGPEDRPMEMKDIFPSRRADELGGITRYNEIMCELVNLKKIIWDASTEIVQLVDQKYFEQRKAEARSFAAYEKLHGKGSFTRGT